ncbi:MAG: hypothetical protein V3S14_16885 [Anaerolineae bacterium]
MPTTVATITSTPTPAWQNEYEEVQMSAPDERAKRRKRMARNAKAKRRKAFVRRLRERR